MTDGDLAQVLDMLQSLIGDGRAITSAQAIRLLREIRRHRLAEAAACQRLIEELQSSDLMYNEDGQLDDLGRPRYKIK
jgi:hypothetical protein